MLVIWTNSYKLREIEWAEGTREMMIEVCRRNIAFKNKPYCSIL